jgi:hypothetical protein
MSTDWKDHLKHAYKNLQQDQKNKKGFQSKFDKVRGYKNKLGFNDTGIPLTAKAVKSLRKNKAAYRSSYVGSTLQQINEERAAEGKERWKHLRAAPKHSTDANRNRTKDFSVSQMIWRNSATERGDRSDGFSEKSTFPGYGYGDAPTDDGSVEIDVSYYKEKSVIDTHPNFDENKFPKVAEAIWKARRGDKN